MKKLFCICILICLLLTSCGGGGEDLNVYTTEPKPETSAPPLDDATTDTGFVVKTHDIPEELREYVPNYTYEPSDDDNDLVLRRLIINLAISGDYLYYIVSVGSGMTKLDMIKRLNLKTGEISSPCFDPVCTHDTTDCNFCFYRVGNIQAMGRYIVFYAVRTIGVGVAAKGYVYDTATGEVYKEVFNSSNHGYLCTWVGCIGDNLYSTVTTKTDNPYATGSDDKTIYDDQTWEYNIPTKTSKLVLSIKNTANVGGFHSVYNGRIYYYDEYRQMYSMYPDGSDVREEPHMADSDYFSGNLRWSNRNTDNSICNIDLTTGKVTTVLSAPGYSNDYQVTNKYVYYYLNIPSKDENGKEKTVGEMWRCDHNGQNAEKLLTLDRGLRFFLVHGNYLYYISSANENQSRLVRIHVETGEVLYIK